MWLTYRLALEELISEGPPSSGESGCLDILLLCSLGQQLNKRQFHPCVLLGVCVCVSVFTHPLLDPISSRIPVKGKPCFQRNREGPYTPHYPKTASFLQPVTPH